TELLIFGNPPAGTPLMQADQTIGIDLPLEALVWEDVSGVVWIAYNDPAWLAVRHGLRHDTADAVHAMAGALAKFAEGEAGGRNKGGDRPRDRPVLRPAGRGFDPHPSN